MAGVDVSMKFALENNCATPATASQDQMSHPRIDILVSVNDMSVFLGDLELAATRTEKSSGIDAKI